MKPDSRPTAAEYVAFKSDRFRLWALISRDIRLIVIALISALGVSGLLFAAFKIFG